MNANITFVPIGSVPPELLTWLVYRLTEVVGQEVTTGESIPLPGAGYDARRQQYHGGSLIAVLRRLCCRAAERIVGLTEADCYAPGLNFIFGQARMEGQETLVALPRLHPCFYGLPEEPALFHERVLKEVVHELGHTWGLSHCADPHCVMHFSNTLHDTDVKGADFCGRCLQKLGERGRLSN